jgi:branched-chain amino acid transport system permease protein
MLVRRNIPLIILTLAIATVPLTISDPYYLTMLIFIGIYAIATMGLNLLMGYAGQISLGHAAFFALGAYVPAILTTRFEVPCLAAAALAVLLSAAVAYIVGLPCLRLKGHYLAMGTLAFGEIIHIILNAEVALTGGPSGIAGIPMLGIGSLNADSDVKYFIVVWIIFVCLFVLTRNIINSRPGRALQALHGSEQAAGAMGIDVAGMKLTVFVLSAAYAALAGVLYVHFVAFISPGAGDIMFSIKMVTMVVVGGMGHLWGGLLGAALLTVLPEMLSYFEDYDMLIYGGILLIMVMFMPGGLTQGFERLLRALRPGRKGA